MAAPAGRDTARSGARAMPEPRRAVAAAEYSQSPLLAPRPGGGSRATGGCAAGGCEPAPWTVRKRRLAAVRCWQRPGSIPVGTPDGVVLDDPASGRLLKRM